MKAHLLYQDGDFDFERDREPIHEDLIKDLELVTLFQAMALGDKFLLEVSKKVILGSLHSAEAIAYRQDILADCIAQPEIIREMYAIAVGALEDKRSLWGYSSQLPSSILVGAVSQLEASVVRLRQLRKIADDHTENFNSVGIKELFHTLQRELDDEYFKAVQHHLKQLRFRNGEVISAKVDRDNNGIDFVLRSAEPPPQLWKERLGIMPRSSYFFVIPPRDEAGAQALSDITSRGINLVANAAAQSADHILSYFTMLRAELGFYVGCLNLRESLTAKGQTVSFPEPLPYRPFVLSTKELCDVCLALRMEQPVVGNAVESEGRPLVIITGANSGGKSTFLRSIGLAQLMMQCGMFVAAGSYRSSMCSEMFTHFIREEDSTMTSGRLEEELGRMSAIIDQISPYSLMLFNESFAATNEREGSEIGRQVVRALLEGDVNVFFVTHQFDFAESFHRHHTESTLFLRAERQPDGRRNFRLVAAAPLPTSFGEDLYYRLGAWLDNDQPPTSANAKEGLVSDGHSGTRAQPTE